MRNEDYPRELWSALKPHIDFSIVKLKTWNIAYWKVWKELEGW